MNENVFGELLVIFFSVLYVKNFSTVDHEMIVLPTCNLLSVLHFDAVLVL